jgi:hypothetical protein
MDIIPVDVNGIPGFCRSGQRYFLQHWQETHEWYCVACGWSGEEPDQAKDAYGHNGVVVIEMFCPSCDETPVRRRL